MSVNLPSKSAIVFIWIILMVYLGYNFFKKPNEILFQMSYDWENFSLIDSIGKVEIDSVSFDYLNLKNNFQVNPTVSTDNTYKLGAPKTAYYFRSSELVISDSQIVFSGVKWINGHPEKNISSGILEIIDLPLKQTGKKTVVTIGDSEMMWMEARDLRKKLYLKNQNLVFKGSKKDVNGFAHEASVYATATEIAENLDKIPIAENYVLFFGAQDKKTENSILKSKICQILEKLALRKETKKIIVISLPPSPVKEFEKYNLAYNKILEECIAENNKSVLIPLHERLREETDYLIKDGVHMNEKGYSILVKLLDRSLE